MSLRVTVSSCSLVVGGLSRVSAYDPPLARADSSDESDSSEDSDIDSETSSALFMAVRQSPGLGWEW